EAPPSRKAACRWGEHGAGCRLYGPAYPTWLAPPSLSDSGRSETARRQGHRSIGRCRPRRHRLSLHRGDELPSPRRSIDKRKCLADLCFFGMAQFVVDDAVMHELPDVGDTLEPRAFEILARHAGLGEGRVEL